MGLPYVSIVILNYKRQSALLQTINAAVRQNYPNFEIIVVDNFSEDNTPELLRNKFPHVQTIGLLSNRGCGGRNDGFAAAKGEIIVSIDNDINFETPQELYNLVEVFRQQPQVAGITFRILRPEDGELSLRDWCHPRSYVEFADKEFPTYSIAEGACAFRKKVLEKTGGYDERFFINHEGFDLVLRILQLEYEIHYAPQVRVRHDEGKGRQKSWRPYFYNTRNYLLLAWKHFRPWFGIRFLAPRLTMLMLLSLRAGHFKYFVKGIATGLSERRSLLPSRSPMTTQTEQIISELSSHRPGLLSRLRKHAKKARL